MSKTRSPFRRVARRPARSTLRTLWRAPDDLRESIVAFRRAIRCHRRLARLAPEFFDSVVIHHRHLRAEQDRQWQAEWMPAFIKVYGAAPDPLPPSTPPMPHPNTQRAIVRLLDEWRQWMDAGQIARERYLRRRPHALMSLNRIVQLTQLAHDFYKVAVGYDPHRPPPSPPDPARFLADLQRAYPNP